MQRRYRTNEMRRTYIICEIITQCRRHIAPSPHFTHYPRTERPAFYRCPEQQVSTDYFEDRSRLCVSQFVNVFVEMTANSSTSTVTVVAVSRQSSRVQPDIVSGRTCPPTSSAPTQASIVTVARRPGWTAGIGGWVSRSLTSHSTLYRSYRGRFLQVR